MTATETTAPPPDTPQEKALRVLASSVLRHQQDRPSTHGLAKHLRSLHSELSVNFCAKDAHISEIHYNCHRMITVLLRIMLEGDASLPHTVPPAEPEDTSKGAINE